MATIKIKNAILSFKKTNYIEPTSVKEGYRINGGGGIASGDYNSNFYDVEGRTEIVMDGSFYGGSGLVVYAFYNTKSVPNDAGTKTNLISTAKFEDLSPSGNYVTLSDKTISIPSGCVMIGACYDTNHSGFNKIH